MHHHLHQTRLQHSIALHQSEMYKTRLSSQSYPLCGRMLGSTACCGMLSFHGTLRHDRNVCPLNAEASEKAHHHVCCDQKPCGNCSLEGRGQQHIVTHIVACTRPGCAQALPHLQLSHSFTQVSARLTVRARARERRPAIAETWLNGLGLRCQQLTKGCIARESHSQVAPCDDGIGNVDSSHHALCCGGRSWHAGLNLQHLGEARLVLEPMSAYILTGATQHMSCQ